MKRSGSRKECTEFDVSEIKREMLLNGSAHGDDIVDDCSHINDLRPSGGK